MRLTWWSEPKGEKVVERLETVADDLEEITTTLRDKISEIRAEQVTENRMEGR